MEFAKIVISSVISVGTLWLVVHVAPVVAQSESKTLKNVRGVDGISLIGSVCRGTYEVSDSRADNGYGAFKFEFSERDGQLSLNQSGQSGMVAYRNAMDPKFELENIGVAQKLEVNGNKVVVVTPRGATYEFELGSGGTLRGTVDPRKIPGREGWSVAKVEGKCVALTPVASLPESSRKP